MAYHTHISDDAIMPGVWGYSFGWRQRFVGHENRNTDIKEAVFMGAQDEFVVAGSDCGCAFIWERFVCERECVCLCVCVRERACVCTGYIYTYIHIFMYVSMHLCMYILIYIYVYIYIYLYLYRVCIYILIYIYIGGRGNLYVP
jgi:hypothetical protein